ncbi:MAG TPA: L-lactate dehydrogenase [Candidatus Ornithomonoglobus intestinigallinarum]|uniref:L-lactate dehydrogenase n=1 Tax=Candidatus Ornithomonoglobus intestinigallinarum TaxID=2840894 RepID=A0A9D1KQC1_9FIRM|nr:L-lactate dehydrogenase [Candidatus Ornithomonoglobus intestinigallinarum]
MFRGKTVIVGAGFVGSTIAYTIMCGGLFNDIVLIDIDKNKAEGDAMDMAHGVSFVKPVNIRSGGYSECADADIVVITAGANQKPGETRLDLLKKNSSIIKDITESVLRFAPPDIILLTVTNPVDILTYITYRVSGLPKNRVLGSGTVLDTSRLKYMLSRHTGIDARNCHTYIIGEHGDSEVAAWSISNIAGIPMSDYAARTGKCTPEDLELMCRRVKNAAYEIIDKKGATYYAIALAVNRICACIAGEENSVLTVSGILEGEYGISNAALSLPTKLSGFGVEEILEVPLSDAETQGLRESAATLKKYITELGF